MSGRGKLDSICNKVVDDLFYSIHIAFYHYIGTSKFMLKKQTLIIDWLCGTVHHTVQQIRYAEWYRVQERLWRAEVEKNPKNEEAWNNYYRAARYGGWENFLKVNGYPTYRLIDRNGNLLDVNADHRNLDALKNLLKAL